MAGPEAAFPLVNAKPVLLHTGDGTDPIIVSGMTPLTPEQEDAERKAEQQAASAERMADTENEE